MKKLLSAILCLTFVFALIPATALADGATEEWPDNAAAAANQLYELGLFKGTGTKADGSPEFELDRAPTRLEALVMLIRLLGIEQEALKENVHCHFKDVPQWGSPM